MLLQKLWKKVVLVSRSNSEVVSMVQKLLVERHYKDGSIPTQTIRADVDFAYERAETPSGTIGLKVWIYKGDVFKK
jgi:hypothetical protein